MRAKIHSLWGSLLRFGFRLLYQEFAWSYDAVSWLVSFGAWQEWQRAALPFVRGSHVLEIGHGPGHMLLALHRAGYHVVGLDSSRQMAAISRRRQQRAGVRIPQLRALAQQLPFQDHAFDSVLATFPTEYVADEETLVAVSRVLTRNGRFIIVPQARFTGESLAESVIEWLYRITGQRPAAWRSPETRPLAEASQFWELISDRFARAGFRLQTEICALERSEVMVIVAEKEA